MALLGQTIQVATPATGGTTITWAVDLSTATSAVIGIGGRTGSQGIISGATHNGSATGWARIDSAFVDAGSGITEDWWSGIGFTPANANLIITFPVAIDTVVWAFCRAYTGGDIAGTPFGTSADQGGTDPLNATASSAVGDECLSMILVRTTGILGSMTPDAGQTELYEAEEVVFGSTFAVSTEAGAASVTSGWTGQGAVSSALRVLPVRAAVGGGSVGSGPHPRCIYVMP